MILAQIGFELSCARTYCVDNGETITEHITQSPCRNAGPCPYYYYYLITNNHMYISPKAASQRLSRRTSASSISRLPFSPTTFIVTPARPHSNRCPATA